MNAKIFIFRQIKCFYVETIAIIIFTILFNLGHVCQNGVYGVLYIFLTLPNAQQF